MNAINLLSPWVKRFILEYMITVRNLARNTQQSYRDIAKAIRILPYNVIH